MSVATKQRSQTPAADDSAAVPPGYKRTEVGVISEDWDAVPLADLFEFKNGLNKAKHFFGVGTPIVNYMDVYGHPGLRIADLNGRVMLSSAEIKNFEVRRGDVFFTRTSETIEEIGVAAVMLDDPSDTVFSGFVLRARSKNQRLQDSYKQYCFAIPEVRSQIISTSSYTTRALTNGRHLSAVFVAIPPPPEQRAITEALLNVDGLLGALDAVIVKKRAIKQAAMQQLLTGKIRLPGFSGEWETKRLGDTCVKIQDGTHFSPRLGGGERIYVTSTNIGFGILDVADAARISEFEHRKIYSRCDTRRGDLLLTKDGANTGNAAINDLDEEVSLLSSVAFLRFDSDREDARFYLQYLLSAGGQRQMKGMMSGNAITRLTLAKIRELQVTAPTLREQTAIATLLSDMDAEITALEARRDKTRDIKQGMMQQLLTGRVRLMRPVLAEASA
jgi:type I restriction enzyme S subunit